MKRSKFSEEQIVYAIRQADAGTPVGDLCRQLGVSDATFYAWKKKYAHLGVSELRRLRQLEEENNRLKRLVADLSLDKHMLAEALRKHRNSRAGCLWEGPMGECGDSKDCTVRNERQFRSTRKNRDHSSGAKLAPQLMGRGYHP